jgi:hypothetical protein
MNPTLIGFAIAGAFVAGVVVHKYVISEAEKVKTHVSQVEARIRTDIANLVSKGASKIAG